MDVDDVSVEATFASPAFGARRVSSGKIPRTPQPAPASHQFAVDASDLADRMIGILVAADKGNVASAEKAFKELKLTVRIVESWNDEQRARAYYFALKLMGYGLCLDPKIVSALSAQPKSELGKAWYNLAIKEEGYPYKPVCPSQGDGAEYIAWKHGRAAKPTAEPWSLVP
jgi:hypothetical protein